MIALEDDERAAIEVYLDRKLTPIENGVGRRLERKGCIVYDYSCVGRPPCGVAGRHAHMRLTHDGLEMYALDTRLRAVRDASRS